MGRVLGGRARRPPPPVRNYVLVTHGLLMRVFCMCYFRWTVTEFEEVWNPGNGEIWVLQKVAGEGTYELAGRWRASRMQPDGRFVDIKYGNNRAEPMPAHMKRPTGSRLVSPGRDLDVRRDARGEIIAGVEDDEVPDLAHLRNLPKPGRWARGNWDEWKAELW